MADINIQRRSSNALWWILGIVAVVLLVWLLFAWTGGDATQPMTGPGASGIPYAGDVVIGAPVT